MHVLKPIRTPLGSRGNRGALPRGRLASGEGQGPGREPLGWRRKKQPEFKVIWEPRQEADALTSPPSCNPHLPDARCAADHRQTRMAKAEHRHEPRVKSREFGEHLPCALVGTAAVPHLGALLEFPQQQQLKPVWLRG